MNIFRDQSKFMKACDQTVDSNNPDQFNLYVNLIEEEFGELKQALQTPGGDRVEVLDALIDILVVTVGAVHSAGFDGEGAWREVMRSNFSKISEDGKVRKREDGKVLKPVTYSPPDLAPYVSK